MESRSEEAQRVSISLSPSIRPVESLGRRGQNLLPRSNPHPHPSSHRHVSGQGSDQHSNRQISPKTTLISTLPACMQPEWDTNNTRRHISSPITSIITSRSPTNIIILGRLGQRSMFNLPHDPLNSESPLGHISLGLTPQYTV